MLPRSRSAPSSAVARSARAPAFPFSLGLRTSMTPLTTAPCSMKMRRVATFPIKELSLRISTFPASKLRLGPGVVESRTGFRESRQAIPTKA